jgi:hypothetical protein
VADFADSAPEPGSVPEPVDGELVPAAGELMPAEGEQVGEVRRLPVLAEADGGQLDAPRPVSLPATAAAATGGFLLGVATFVLVRVLRRPSSVRLARRRGRLAARRRGVDVESTRSFLIDVHLLKR